MALVESGRKGSHEVEVVLRILHHFDRSGVVGALALADREVYTHAPGAGRHGIDPGEPVALEDVAAHAAGVVLHLEIEDRGAEVGAWRGLLTPIPYTCPGKFFPAGWKPAPQWAGFQPAKTFLDSYIVEAASRELDNTSSRLNKCSEFRSRAKWLRI